MANGSMPLWLFIHGLGCAPFTMAPLLAATPRGHPSQLADLYGDSLARWRPGEAIPAERTEITAIAGRLWHPLDAQGHDQVLLVAHSWGCRIALAMLRARPAAVAGLVLLDGSRLVHEALLGQPQLARRAVLERLGADPPDAERERRFITSLISQCFLPGLTPETIRGPVGEAMGRLPPAWFAASFAAVASWEACELLSALATLSDRRVPLLAIQATSLDAARGRLPLQSLEQSDWIRLLQQRCPHGDCWLAPPSGHFVQLEQSGPVLERIRLWWRRQGARTERQGPRP